MTSNIRAFGFTLLAILSLSALTASVGSASEHVATSDSKTSKTIVTAEQVGASEDNYFEVTGKSASKITCKKAIYNGTFIGSEVKKASVVPTFLECTAPGMGGAATLTNENCEVVLLSETNATNHLVLPLECEAGKFIRISAGGCVINFGTQTPTMGAKLTTEESGGKKDMKLDVTLETTFTTNDALGCTLAGVPNHGAWTGTLVSTVTIKGFEDSISTPSTYSDVFSPDATQINLTDHTV
jgi:hypothetical protein